MNKKFINALLFSAALLSTGMVSSCKDYDDDIDALETRVTTLEEAMKTLEAKFDAGKFITSFAANSSNTGYVLTLSDGSTLEIKNGENGATGAAGQNGTTWEIDETTKEWVKVNPDGSRENTGIIAEGQKGEQGEPGEPGQPGQPGQPGEPGQPGKDGHSPYINETNQKWMVWNDETGKYEETQYSAVGESSYVVKYDNYYELNVAIADANGVPTGEFQKLVMPVTGTISSLKVYTASRSVENELHKGADVQYAYSYNQQAKTIEFNGKTYEPNQILSSAAATFVAEVNPLDADATKYNFYLRDSKGQSAFEISSVEQNKTKDAIVTRAAEEATANEGFYNMSIKLKDGINLNDINTSVSYALATTNYNGETITSDYAINIAKADDNITGNLSATDFNTNTHEVSVEKGISFDELLREALTKTFYDKALNIADFYFTLPQNQTANNEEPQFSIDLNNRRILAKNASSSVVTLKLHYLTINGTVVEGEEKAINVKVQAVSAKEASIGDFTWTVQKSNKAENMKAVVDVTGLENYISDGMTANVTYKFANDIVYVNGVALTPENKAKIEEDINNRYIDDILPGTLKFVKGENDAYGYPTYTAELDFTNYVSTIYAEPFIAEVTLTNKENAQEETTFSFKVDIKAPEYTLDRSKAYFNGDNALVLDQNGDWSAVDGILHFDLTKLYANFNGNATATDGSKISFKETVPNKNDKGEKATAWLQTDKKTVYVGEYNEDKENGIYNTGAGSERTFDVTCVPFGNKNLELVKETIVVKASTRVHEGIFGYGTIKNGKLEAGKNVEITNTDVKEVAVTAFAGMEAETEKLYKFWDEYTDFLGSDYSAIVQDVKVEGDDNAKQNLEFNGFVANSSSVYVLKVQKKEGITVQTETKCNITVTITDRLGLTKSAVVPVILKPTAVAGE